MFWTPTQNSEQLLIQTSPQPMLNYRNYFRSGEWLLALSQRILIRVLKKADSRPPLRCSIA